MPRHILTVAVKGSVNIKVAQFPRSHTWVGVCDPLGFTLEADTFRELTEMIHESIDGMMTELLREGHLSAFLQKRGWALRQPAPLPTMLRRERRLSFDVPYQIQKMSPRDLETVPG